jgi:hypothetical protein
VALYILAPGFVARVRPLAAVRALVHLEADASAARYWLKLTFCDHGKLADPPIFQLDIKYEKIPRLLSNITSVCE